MYDQTRPGSDYLDLESIVDQYRSELELDEDDQDYTFISDVDGLMEWLGVADLDGLDDYSDNEPLMISEEAFPEYAEQLAEDIGAIDRDAGWPLYHIDWDAAAEALKIDYSHIKYGGYDYWVRSY